MKIFNRLFGKRARAGQDDMRPPQSSSPTPKTKTDEISQAQQPPTEDDEAASAQQWVRDRLQSGDFRALAAISATCTRDNYYQSHAARSALRDAGPLAVEAMVKELELDFSHYLVDLLIGAGDSRAVPVLKKYSSKERVYLLQAYGVQAKVEEFISRFDSEFKKKIDGVAQAEKEKFARAITEARQEVRRYDEGAMLSALRKLCHAYATLAGGDPEIQRLEPIATAIGERLNSIGGIEEMRRVFAKLQGVRGARTLEMHWGGIGDWQG